MVFHDKRTSNITDFVAEVGVQFPGPPSPHIGTKAKRSTRTEVRGPLRANRVGATVGMELQLPHPIASYVRAENSGDIDAISKCFAPYATLREDDGYIEGRPAIKAWKATTPKQSITPLAIDVADGIATLKARVSGRYPGNPVTAEFHFAVVDDYIVSLRIRSEPREWLS